MTQSQFYNSTKWRRLSRCFLQSRYYICERCGAPADIAHHKQHISTLNIENPNVTLNIDLLEALCLECHNREHFGTGGAVLQGLHFTPDGDIIKGGSTL